MITPRAIQSQLARIDRSLITLFITIVYMISSPLGLYVVVAEHAQGFVVTVTNLFVAFLPFGGLINMLFFCDC